MRRAMSTAQQPKLSREFTTRLARLRPQQKVRAIVLLTPTHPGSAATQHRSRLDRQATITKLRQSTAQTLGELDNILTRFDGKRLAEVNALGSVPVEIAAAGIPELAASAHVKAILEDQPIASLMK